jgi:hypothetical protein
MTTSTTIHVPFVDLRAQHADLAAEIQSAVQQVFERGDFIQGAAVERFEAEFAAYIGLRRHHRSAPASWRRSSSRCVGSDRPG